MVVLAAKAVEWSEDGLYSTFLHVCPSSGKFTLITGIASCLDVYQVSIMVTTIEGTKTTSKLGCSCVNVVIVDACIVCKDVLMLACSCRDDGQLWRVGPSGIVSSDPREAVSKTASRPTVDEAKADPRFVRRWSCTGRFITHLHTNKLASMCELRITN
ncbi:unnamed protein product [Protopolystoma xenopodis]|uniref:Uncharacterized protein n=1 Tax=Protopolystoma xenopodis TaxID=117903 RepID=A0A3S5BC70_9PLAT|nr:unnamed protein product [Protopolystoma xenopodis]